MTPPRRSIFATKIAAVFWTPTPLPVRELDAYRARHGQGYTEFEHNSHALEQTLLTFVPVQADRADPIRIQRLRIRNRSSRSRRLSVTVYSEFVLGTDREATQMHVACTWDESSKALICTQSLSSGLWPASHIRRDCPGSHFVYQRPHGIPRPQWLAGSSSRAAAGIAFESHRCRTRSMRSAADEIRAWSRAGENSDSPAGTGG